MELPRLQALYEKYRDDGFEIVALDPETMDFEVAFSHSGPPMGEVTVAVPQAGRVWMGSFAGDRLISVKHFTRSEN